MNTRTVFKLNISTMTNIAAKSLFDKNNRKFRIKSPFAIEQSHP